MNKILRFFRPLFKFNYSHPYAVIGISVILTVAASWFALQLKVNTDIANLLPEDNPYVLALEELQQTVGGEIPFTVLIQSPDFEDNLQFARELIDESMQLEDDETGRRFFERVNFRKETELIEENALYFATSQELNAVTEYLRDEIRQAKQAANPFYVDLTPEDENAAEDEEIDALNEKLEGLIPSEYPVNADSTAMIVRFLPAGSSSDIDYLSRMFASYDSLLATMNPSFYNDQMEVEFGGRLQLQLIQFKSVMKDVFNSFAIGIGAIILLVMLYFFISKYRHYRRGSPQEQTHAFWEHAVRMPVPVLVIGLPLIISLAFTFCITYWVLGMLNIMTAVLFVILFGLGIDYGIHFYGRYIELRSEGLSIKQTLIKTYNNTGLALVASALTTALSLYVLIFASFRGFSEFGFIAGTGIILAVFCMLFILPSILVIFEKWGFILFNETVDEQKNRRLFNRFPFARGMVIAGFIISVVVIIFSYKLDFQYDFSELSPEVPEHLAFRDKVVPIIGGNERRNPAYILADTREQVREIADSLRKRMRTDTTSPTIFAVEAITERFPATDSAATAKLQKISRIRQLLQDPVIAAQESEELERLITAAQSTEPLQLEEVPDYFKNQYLTKSGEIGNFVIVYASGSMADGRRSIAFKEDVGKITLDNGETFYAAGSSIIAAEMLDLLRNEAPWMVGATLFMVFLLMLIAFRSLKWALIALIPLIVGFLWLFAVMIITGIKFNLYNLVVLPAILGIGDDSGIHIAQRYIEEGKGSLGKVLSSTGQHVLVASFTTMLGFAGVLFADHPGLQSLGVMGVVGIAATLLAAFTFMPALIQWLEDKGWVG